MNSFPVPVAIASAPNGWRAVLRQPLPWIVAWATYSLLALGWFGYRDAWFGFMCIASK